MIKNSLVFYILFLLGSSFAQELEILSSGDQNYKQIDPTNITTEFLYFQTGPTLDSIQIEDIKSVIIENESDIPFLLKEFLGQLICHCFITCLNICTGKLHLLFPNLPVYFLYSLLPESVLEYSMVN